MTFECQSDFRVATTRQPARAAATVPAESASPPVAAVSLKVQQGGRGGAVRVVNPVTGARLRSSGMSMIAVIGVCVLLLIYCAWKVITYVTWLKTANVLTMAEKTFVCPELGGKRQPFPSVMDEPSVYVSLIVPSYKEEERLPRMLDETLVYLQRRQRRDAGFTFEVVIVDDGSGDGTTTCALKFVHQYTSNVVRVLTLRQNRGKGFAVKTGMQHARGQLLLMVDADGATRIADLENLEARLRQVQQVWLAAKASNQPGIINGDCAIAIGSRAPPQALYQQDAVVVQRDGDRSLVSNLFRLLRRLLMPTEGLDLGGMNGGVGVEQEGRALQDTQCGFKLFTRGAAQLLFNNQHLDRWAFDVELMYLAKQLQLPVVEVPVTWSEVDGSKLSMVRDGIRMAIDMLIARVLYVTGVQIPASCLRRPMCMFQGVRFLRAADRLTD